ncbi:MAG: hypothetical protein U5K43_08080 [Halofilum sp. (in: g-proteobacteria)]|nr:hypothetical protein [Halofilum sp. (in: g-proteobacteria)]
MTRAWRYLLAAMGLDVSSDAADSCAAIAAERRAGPWQPRAAAGRRWSATASSHGVPVVVDAGRRWSEVHRVADSTRKHGRELAGRFLPRELVEEARDAGAT